VPTAWPVLDELARPIAWRCQFRYTARYSCSRSLTSIEGLPPMDSFTDTLYDDLTVVPERAIFFAVSIRHPSRSVHLSAK
jgi:hypothetical protein